MSYLLAKEIDGELMVSADEFTSLQSKYAAVCAELEELQNSLPKIKADAVRDAETWLEKRLDMVDYGAAFGGMLKYADKLEKGE